MAHLCNRYSIALVFSIHSVSILSLSATVGSYGRHVPDVVDVFIQLPLQQLEFRHRVRTILVVSRRLSGTRTVHVWSLGKSLLRRGAIIF
jgi:hypothetical protein